MPSETTSKTAIYVKAALFIILMLIAGFFLAVFFLIGIFGSLLTGDYRLFFVGILSFILFLVVGTLAKKFESAWRTFEEIKGIRPKTTREAFKDSLPFFAILSLTFIIAFVIESYFLSFPSAISPRLAEEMLKSILAIDGILIGFNGVVLAQFLWAIHSKGNVIYEQLIKNREDKATVKQLNDEVERLSRTRIATIATFFYSMLPLLASILLCLNKLPLVEGNQPVSPRTLMFDPILALIAGIALLSIATLQTSLLPKALTEGET